MVFVDESEWPRPKDPSGFTVWAAIAIDPKDSKDFFRNSLQLKRRFLPFDEADDYEIKGRRLLSRRAVRTPWKAAFCKEVVTLYKATNVKAFAAVLRNADTLVTEGLTEPIVYRVYSRINEGVNAMMVERGAGEMAIIALDSQDEGTDTQKARALGTSSMATLLGVH